MDPRVRLWFAMMQNNRILPAISYVVAEPRSFPHHIFSANIQVDNTNP